MDREACQDVTMDDFVFETKTSRFGEADQICMNELNDWWIVLMV